MPRRVPEEAIIIGKNLREIRKSYGYSQTALGKYIGVTPQQIQKYENGQNRLPAEKLHHLHCFLNIPLERFFRDLPHAKQNTSEDIMHSVLERLIAYPDRAQKRKIIQAVEILLS